VLVEEQIEIRQNGYNGEALWEILLTRRLSENSVRSEIERKFRRRGGKGKITGGVINATLRIFWPFQRGRRSLQPIATEGYCRTASQGQYSKMKMFTKSSFWLILPLHGGYIA